MRFKTVPLLVSSVIGFGLVFLPTFSSLAQSTDIRFGCGEHNGTPATIGVTPDGSKPVILWVESLGGYTPEQRCRLASINFQRYIIQQGMDRIAVINRNGLPVFCAYFSAETAGCSGYLFTASSWEDIGRYRRRLENAGLGLVGIPIEQGGQDSFSFSLIEYLSNDSESSSNAFPIPQ